MDLELVQRLITQDGDFTAVMDPPVLVVTSEDTSSSFVVEIFGESYQVRQGVAPAAEELTDEQVAILLQLCSTVNERFTGCKNLIDKWGMLQTMSDILGPISEIGPLKVVLGQVEYVSLAMLDLYQIVQDEERLPTEAEIDEALEVPEVH